jgi:rRNA processing protein Krr1/Pno1
VLRALGSQLSVIKIFIFEFRKDKVEVFKETDKSDSRENIIKDAAAHCGAKIDENRLNGNLRVMKVRCTKETQQTHIILKCSEYISSIG